MTLHSNEKALVAGASFESAQRAAILIHGRGASPESMLSIADVLMDGQTHIVMPRATSQTWYPYSFISPKSMNEPWLSAAVHHIVAELTRLSGHFGSENVILAGFSQGACLALESAVSFNRPLKAVAGFSGGLIGPGGTVWDEKPGMNGTPVLLGCHEKDPHIPLERVQETARVFRKKQAPVTLQVYPGTGHHIMPVALEWLENTSHHGLLKAGA